MSESKKLVDILAREMSEWPDDSLHAVSQYGGGSLRPEPLRAKVPVTRFSMASDAATVIVTRAEWQAARDALLAAEAAPVWSGEGIPGTGQSCNIRFTDHPGSSPHPVTILSFGRRKVFYRDAQGDEFLHDREYVDYSPIRTPEQIKADEREASISEMVYGDCKIEKGDGDKTAYAICEVLYDAGYRKVDQ